MREIKFRTYYYKTKKIVQYVGNLQVKWISGDSDCIALSAFALCDSNEDIVYHDFDRVKVIGNIYQNPELL